jgi:hypothetical protein
MVVVGMAQVAGHVEAGVERIAVGALAAVICAAAGSGFLQGKEWARRLYVWLTPVGLATDLVVGENGLMLSGFSWRRFVVGLGAYGVFAFFLTRPSTAAFFKRE